MEDILCEQYQRTVGKDNCVKFDGLVLRYRSHYVRVKVKVHRYPDGRLAVFYGPRKLASYNSQGKEINHRDQAAA